MSGKRIPNTVEGCHNYISELHARHAEQLKDAKEAGRAIELERVRTAGGTLPNTPEGCWRYVEWLRQKHAQEIEVLRVRINKRNQTIQERGHAIERLERILARYHELIRKKIYIARLRQKKAEVDSEAST